ncbi:hypothetical protein FGRMN_9507 [Fusarium graminum]|nr:hypothetical protein FGRMN_9507 [Fusarium graminum]
MSADPQTVNIPATKDEPAPIPSSYIDNRSKTALRELQNGDLLQLIADYVEGEFLFADLKREIGPDSLAQFFQVPAPNKFAFYRHPTGAVVLIWSRFPATSSAMKGRASNRARRDLAWYAEQEGIRTVNTLHVNSQKDVTSERLQEAIGSSARDTVS